jgi:hypothetical protein
MPTSSGIFGSAACRNRRMRLRNLSRSCRRCHRPRTPIGCARQRRIILCSGRSRIAAWSGQQDFSGSPASLADSGDDAVDGNRVVRIDRVQAFWFQKPKSPCRRCFCRGRTPRVHAGCIFGPAAVAILIASSKQIGVSRYNRRDAAFLHHLRLGMPSLGATRIVTSLSVLSALTPRRRVESLRRFIRGRFETPQLICHFRY